MKCFKFLLLFFFIVVLASNVNAEEKDFVGFIGGNLGLAFSPDALSDETINSVGGSPGVTGKIFFDKVGLGATFTYLFFDDSKDYPGNFKSKAKLTTADLMANIAKDDDGIFYALISAGTIQEHSRGDSSFYSNNDSAIYGAGLGWLGKLSQDDKLSCGADVKYLLAPDLKNTNNLLQLTFSVGYTFD